ncbi:MAG TPA: pentapeptide repeat-containing protein, partial [Promineifilum sp.]|nr:pentapeptide repeat-containing protein [Promineifilum sp.]
LWLADLAGADMRGANLRSTDMRESNLVGADLSETTLQDTNLTGSRFDANTRWPVGFDPIAAGAIARSGAARPEPQREPID